MSVVKRIIKDSIEKVKVDELLADEYVQAGYGGITLTKTPLGAPMILSFFKGKAYVSPMPPVVNSGPNKM